MIEKTMTVSAAAENFDEVVRRAHDLNESTLLVENDQPRARVIPILPHSRPAEELAAAWRLLPHLTGEQAEAFAADVEECRSKLPPPTSQWE